MKGLAGISGTLLLVAAVILSCWMVGTPTEVVDATPEFARLSTVAVFVAMCVGGFALISWSVS